MKRVKTEALTIKKRGKFYDQNYQQVKSTKFDEC